MLIRGIPGSGKSTLAAAIRLALGKRATVLDPDAVEQDSDDYRQYSGLLDEAGVHRRLHLFRFLRESARTALGQGRVVLWNQPFTDEGIFRALIGWFAALPLDIRIVVVELDLAPDIAFRRVVERAGQGGHGISRELFAEYVADYRKLSGLGCPTISIRTDSPPHLIVDSLVLAAGIAPANRLISHAP